MEREIDPKKITKTSDDLAKWINKEFAGSHLAKIADEVHVFAQQAVARAARIRRPFWLVRITLFLMAIGGISLAVHQFLTNKFSLYDVLKFMDDAKGSAAYIVAALIVLFTLETRWKRKKALQAVNDLRAMVHIVDMHQLAKDQCLLPFKENLPQEKFTHYLHSCTALLALLSKIGEVYVEHFPDEVAIQAVNDFEMVANGLSNKIWMKILSLESPKVVEKASKYEFKNNYEDFIKSYIKK